MKARAMNAKRREREQHGGTIPRSEASSSGADEVLLERLDHELSRLPDRYRVPVVLCELEGRSRREVARMLGIPEGTLSSRLAKAKKLLARKLSRYGTIALAALISERAASACLSPALRASTVKAVLSAGAVPAKVLALTEGMMKAMLLSKLKITACAAALMLAAGLGATGLTYRATAEQPALASRPQYDELEALRLEIEALRKSLQATREQVRSLAEEMRILKSADRNPTGMMPKAETPAVAATRATAPTLAGPPATARSSRDSSLANVAAPAAETRPVTAASTSVDAFNPKPQGTAPGNIAATTTETVIRQGQNSSPKTADPFTKPTTAASDPLTHAEKALQRLRQNPGDKQAVESLERALKKLKEREKPDQPGEQSSKP
jgi:hypothetical protein